MLPLVKENSGLKWLYSGTVLFAAISLISITFEFFWIFAAPLLFLVIAVSFYRLDLMMFFAVVITPLSINLAKTGLGIGVSLPSEPIIFGIMLLFLFKMLFENSFDKKVLFHPVSLAIIFHLLWMFVTTATSSMAVVSFKATLARFCFVIVFFFLGTQVFKNIDRIKTFSWCYIIPLLIVIAYTTFNHALAGFTEKAAHTVMVPFYNDHTAYAALIAMFIPMTFGFIFDKTSSSALRITSAFILLIFLTSIILSYTRASWISLVAALLCYLVFVFRIKTSVVVTGIAVTIILLLSYQTQITMMLERNEEESSTDYASHVQSMSNISTDASNVERLNRWSSAFRMFEARPFFGWGPGTYMFQYAPFQKWSEKTIISTNFGEGGNAHSEYIGPLAEQGVFGPLLFILIGALVIYRGSRIIIYSPSQKIRTIAKGLLFGLITYWVHGMLNNFLDTEKASVPFWAFIGAIVALDVYHLPHQNRESSKENISQQSLHSGK